MKNIMEYGFTLFWIIATAVCLYLTKEWNSMTALFPRVVTVPMLALTIAILTMDVRAGRRQNGEGEKEDAAEFRTTNRRMVKYFGWLIGFAALIWAIGVIYAIPIYIFAYMKIEGKYRWLKSGIYAIVTTVSISVLFEYAFRVAWPKGILLRLLHL